MGSQSQEELFRRKLSKEYIPLAERMRPRALAEILGQDQAIGPGSALAQVLRTRGAPIPSVILWGPPGTGKTTIARVIADASNYRFRRMSGVMDGVQEIRDAVEGAEQALKEEGRPTLLLVDEVHRFNRTQQDAFLPHLESGLLVLIGQTTENVSYRLRTALLSRLRVVQLKELGEEFLIQVIERALCDKERGLGEWGLSMSGEAKQFLARLSMGDARRALTGLEWAAVSARNDLKQEIKSSDIERCYGTQPIAFDQGGDYHYNTISAFIKSLRGSDPDAALYYMVRALEGGEDPLFITRRMIIFASEDVSCDPRALEMALNVDRAVERLGMPEGRIVLAHGVVYLASCQKSNASYKALRAIEQVVREHPNCEIPRRLRNAPTDLMGELGNAEGYRYPHDYPGGFVAERYLPADIENLVVYEPTDRGIDAQIKERLQRLRALIAAENKS